MQKVSKTNLRLSEIRVLKNDRWKKGNNIKNGKVLWIECILKISKWASKAFIKQIRRTPSKIIINFLTIINYIKKNIKLIIKKY